MCKCLFEILGRVALLIILSSLPTDAKPSAPIIAKVSKTQIVTVIIYAANRK
jgi:hypothetical protein